MRLLSLDLERYGPFTGRRLAFRPDARLHVVLGPNEAGKSCALAAVTDLLFGTKETTFEFLHRENGLRLGAEIVARDGRQLAFHRRRGSKKALSDGSGAVISDDALVHFLGGMTRSVFCNAFGMNAAVLRRGAADMLKSEGELGATLFAAASGLRGFRDAGRGLEEEAAKIFAPAARTRRMNELIRRYDEFKKAAGAERIGETGWRKLETGLAVAEGQLEAISAERKANAAESNRLRRLKSVAPILARLDSLAEEASRFADLPEVDDASVAEFAHRLGEAASASDALAAARTALAAAEHDLVAVPVDPVIEPHADAIAALVERKAAYEQSVAERPGVAREADGLDRDLSHLATRLGLADARAAETGQPTDMARARLKRALALGRDIGAERHRLERDLSGLRKAHAVLLKAWAERGALTDPGPSRALYEAIQPALAHTARRDELAAEIANETVALDAALRRLRPPLGAGADLSDLAIPSGEAIRRVGDGLETAARRADGARDRVLRARAAADEAAARMDSPSVARTPPDPAALVAVRRARDEAWATVRAAAFGEAGAPAGAALLQSAALFERANSAADDLADRLVEDAAQAAHQAADEREHRKRLGDVAAAEAELAGAKAARSDSEAEWSALWTPVLGRALPRAEMTEWRGAVVALTAKHDALMARRAELARLAGRVEAVRPQLAALAERLGIEGAARLDAALVEVQVLDRLRRLTETWDGAREALTRMATAQEAIDAAEAASAASAAKEVALQAEWSEALTGLGLPSATSFEAAEAALEAWSEAPTLVRERANRVRRVEGMSRNIERYEADARRLGDALGVDPDRTAVETARILQERLRTARDAAVLRGTREAALGKASEAFEAARLAAERATQDLAATVARWSFPAEAGLATLAARLEERGRLRRQARDIREELARAGEGVPEAILRGDLAGTDPDEIEGRLSSLAATDERLNGEGQEAFAERARLRADRSRIEGGTGAEMATARKSAVEVEIRETARRYVVLKLGSLLLGAAIERRRAGQQDPLLRRAGELFSALTGGAFAGLDQVFNDKDELLLAGRRSRGGQPVAVGDLSEGTTDQLYLALRLAYLEDFAQRAEPAPFLGDDIFASFDDARTGHGLAALAAIGRDVQPILFTHHESVARMAEHRLGSEVDIIALN